MSAHSHTYVFKFWTRQIFDKKNIITQKEQGKSCLIVAKLFEIDNQILWKRKIKRNETKEIPDRHRAYTQGSQKWK